MYEPPTCRTSCPCYRETYAMTYWRHGRCIVGFPQREVDVCDCGGSVCAHPEVRAMLPQSAPGVAPFVPVAHDAQR